MEIINFLDSLIHFIQKVEKVIGGAIGVIIIYLLIEKQKRKRIKLSLKDHLRRLEVLIHKRNPWHARIEVGWIESPENKNDLKDYRTVKEWRSEIEVVHDLFIKYPFLRNKRCQKTVEEFLDAYNEERMARHIYGFGSDIEKLTPYQERLNASITTLKRHFFREK